jgi:hypothetical protein
MKRKKRNRNDRNQSKLCAKKQKNQSKLGINTQANANDD